MDNKAIVERTFDFAVAVREKNSAIATALQRATIPMLEYRKPLASISRGELLKFKGIGPATVGFLERIIAGEDIETVVAEVPKIVRSPRQPPSEYQSRDRGNWDGSWDNSVRHVEGD